METDTSKKMNPVMEKVFDELSTAIGVVKQLRIDEEDGDHKDEKVNRLVNDMEIMFLKHKDACLAYNRPKYWYLFGSMYRYAKNSSKAIEYYSKAVKLDPSMIKVWNELGELYWHKGEKDTAKNCFEKALSREKNKVSLRNLSLIVRQEAQESNTLKKENIEKGLSYAKEALSMDFSDGHSWTVVGNSYLSYYFLWKQEKCYLDQAIQAYTQAERTEDAKRHPEVHHNKGVALQFKESYKEAIECFRKALEIDQGFKHASEKLNELIGYLDTILTHIQTKGKLRTKKLKAYAQDLRKHKTTEKDSAKNLLEIDGANADIYTEGKVLWSTAVNDNFPFTFGLMDMDENVAVVTVYNLALGKGVLIGDTVALLSPEVENVNFSCNGKEYQFRKLRIDSPLKMLVNKKCLPLAYKSLGCLRIHGENVVE